MGKKEFCKALDICLLHANITNEQLANDVGTSSSSVSNWRHGTRNFKTRNLQKIIDGVVMEMKTRHKQTQYQVLNALHNGLVVCDDNHTFTNPAEEIGILLANAYYFSGANINDEIVDSKENTEDVFLCPESCNAIRAIVFDFDGTLTNKKVLNSIWEEIWEALGYDRKICREFHAQYDKKLISHQEWCDITCEYFQKRDFHVDLLERVSSKITLLQNVDKMFLELKRRNIDIYIISGSIISVIRAVLGPLNMYVKDVRANDMVFNREGYLERIDGTIYDFEGKADYINTVLRKKNISPKDVLFVGNSNNDEYVKSRSGALTLCINPASTNYHEHDKWDDVIIECSDAMDIIDWMDK